MKFALLFYGITLATIVLSRLFAGSWKWGYFLGGLWFGIQNEFLFVGCWTYSDKLKPFIWHGIPLVVVLGWGTIGMLAMSISDRVRRFVPATAIRPAVLLFLVDVAVYLVYGLVEEVTMSKQGFWTYNLPLQAWLPFQIVGYFGVGMLVSSLGRRFQGFLEPA
jgi:hypothetical protein